MYPLRVTIKAKGGEGTAGTKLTDIEVIATIHTSNIWFEPPNCNGFSITTDQAQIILGGIAKERSIDKIMQERNDWAKEIFPEATAASSLIKLQGEVEELEVEVLGNIEKAGKNEIEEIADCIMCLFDIGMRRGYTVQEIQDALDSKMTKNRNRTWIKNADNTYSHEK